MNSRHVDVTDISLARLSALVTTCVASGVSDTFRKHDVRQALAKDVENGTVSASSLRETLRAEIEKEIQKQAEIARRKALSAERKRRIDEERANAATAPDKSSQSK